MTGGEVLYFELNALGQLAETERKDMAGDVACLDIGPIPEGRQRARFLVVGSYDSTVCSDFLAASAPVWAPCSDMFAWHRCQGPSKCECSSHELYQSVLQPAGHCL